MKLGTRLTLYLSLIIIIVLSGYGYFHIVIRRDILIRKMKVEVRSVGSTLKVTLEKISLPREMEYVQDLIDAVEEYERTLGVMVYHQGKDLLFRSRSLNETQPYLDWIKKSIQEDVVLEEFGVHLKTSVFGYTFPLKDKRGKNIGGVSILQHTSFMEEDIRKAKWTIFFTILAAIGGTVGLVVFVTRKWVNQPISQLMKGIEQLGKGHFDTRIHLKGEDELSDLARSFNEMAGELKKAQERVIREAEIKLELERSLRQSEKLATVGQLASGLAHEMGTPLNIIGGRAEWIKGRLDDKEGAQKNLDIIVQQTERITKIIQQLLGFVRKKRPEQKVLNVDKLLETSLDFLDHQIQKQEIRVAKEISDGLPPVMGDPDQLQQVFLNLMLNAVQSMPEGGLLHLSASSKWISKESIEEGQRRYVVVSVRDTGLGMEKDVVQHIFNPFFTTKDTGTGLGLMVSQGIVQDHEGWMEVESELGKGSLFKIYLPTFKGEVKSE
ncbi:MAG: HAMP domain-containing protein [Syntrophaceae bacterium]|nr:HAMP domain-containing protein [Syntrophaceae bacterium]